MHAHDGRMRSRVAVTALAIVFAAGLAACDEGGPSAVPAGTNGDTPSSTTDPRVDPSAAAAHVDTLVETLRSGTRTERAAAAAELGTLGDEAAVPALAAALEDESWDVRAAAAEALGALPDPAAVAPLLALVAREPGPPDVGEEDLWAARDACNSAVAALGVIGDAAAVPRLAAIATDGASGLDREAAAAAVVAIGEAGLPALQKALASAGPAQAAALVVLVARLGDPALGPLVAALKDKRTAVKVAAAKALGAFGSAAVKPLIAVLSAKSLDLRKAAAGSLGTIGDPRANPGLVRLMADSAARSTASRALVSINRGNASPLVKYLKSKSTVQVYRPLIRIGQGNTVSALVKALERFGSKTMGETYLNCGQPKLEKAARAWARAHGYIVVPSAGAGEEAWGAPS